MMKAFYQFSFVIIKFLTARRSFPVFQLIITFDISSIRFGIKTVCIRLDVNGDVNNKYNCITRGTD